MNRLKSICIVFLVIGLQGCATLGEGGATPLALVTLPLRIVGAIVGAAVGSAVGMGMMPGG
ncbi:hypothetical protein [Candidatus Berkiella aquae]|uniref:Lipoprotein n=1 Tax=Candidatus Berkiella aquae TaxID=295108 RepID=A0A0Q9YXK2_9GAMM|nr:hypothetical protein [Candidatus Berkiella aquae]MCS5710591.1 hypothetical protein [Candidatus Berkiella aquae]